MLKTLEAQGGQHICLAAGTDNTQKTDGITTYTLNRPRGPLSEKSNFVLANIIHNIYIFFNRGCDPLIGPTSSSRGGFWPSGKQRNNMLFLAILGNFWCLSIFFIYKAILNKNKKIIIKKNLIYL